VTLLSEWRRNSLVWLAVLQRLARSRLSKTVIIVVGLIAMISYSAVGRPTLHHEFIHVVLWMCLCFFAFDWLGRIFQALRITRLRKYLSSGSFLIDALSVLPVPTALALQIPSETAWLFASLWLFPLATLSPDFIRLGRVLSREARPLSTVLVLFIMILLFAAIAMYLVEGRLQQSNFRTIPDSLWWAVETLTTTGYGDAVPQTLLGRLIAAIVMICGLGVFGMLAGILATGFVQENRRETFMQNWTLVQNVPFFSGLEPTVLVEIARMLRKADAAEGATIIRKGRRGDCMYFVAAGKVEVQVEPPVRMGVGSFFGEMALLGSGVRTATVTAVLPTTLLILESADFRVLAAHYPAITEAIKEEAKLRGGTKSESVEI
jgi:voltage-gated potassium channel